MNDLPSVPQSDPSVLPASEIPSVVSVSQSHNRIKMIGFIAFMLVLAIIVTRSGRSKEVVPVSIPEPAIATSPLPPQMVIALNRARTRTVSESFDRMSGEATLLDVRRKSPVLIFNKNQTASTGGAELNRGSINESAPQGSSVESAGASAPLPQGFSPSVTTSAQATSLGNRDTIIAQGKIIDAVLETAVNSEHPGMTRALVSHDIYGDSGNTVLLPRGSRLIGQYDSGVSKGQDRVFVIWQRAIRPDGVDIQLGSAGTDTLGRTGVEGDVDHHFLAMFGAATLLSVIGAATSTVGVNPADQNNSLAQYRQGMTSGFNSAASTVLGQFVQINPTITIKQGEMIKVFVARDLYFDPALFADNGVRWVP